MYTLSMLQGMLVAQSDPGIQIRVFEHSSYSNFEYWAQWTHDRGDGIKERFVYIRAIDDLAIKSAISVEWLAVSEAWEAKHRLWQYVYTTHGNGD